MALHVDLLLSLETVEAELRQLGDLAVIVYGKRSCWWSHREADARQPFVDPLGFSLCRTRNWEGFLLAAQQNPARYGRHGIVAFQAAHHQNCRHATSGAPWASRRWDDYNAAIDAVLVEEAKFKRKS